MSRIVVRVLTWRRSPNIINDLARYLFLDATTLGEVAEGMLYSLDQLLGYIFLEVSSDVLVKAEKSL